MTNTLAKIITEQNPSSPPVRGFEWGAYWDDYDGAPDGPYHPLGHGKTESQAIADLIESTIDTDLDDGRIEELSK